jgi:hypothetical protein
MLTLKRTLTLALAAVALLGGTVVARAQAAHSEVSGTMVGNTGGAFESWNVTLPANTDVSLTLMHWPCDTGNAVGLEVWTASGMAGRSSQKDACTQSLAWNSGSGGAAEVKLYNYLPWVGTWWTLTSDGFTLPGAPAPSTTMAASTMASTTASTTASTASSMTAGTTMAAPADTMAPASTAAMAPAPAAPAAASGAMMAAPAAMVNVDNAVLYGDAGGASSNYDMLVKEGTTYNATLSFASPNGGNWPGVGFTVWGPNGQVAASSMTDPHHASATFTADGNVKYTIQVYNYHPGVPVFYHLDVAAAQ